MSFINALAGSNRGSRYPTVPNWGDPPSLYGLNNNISSGTNNIGTIITPTAAGDIIFAVVAYEGQLTGAGYVNYITSLTALPAYAPCVFQRYSYNYYENTLAQPGTYVVHEVWWGVSQGTDLVYPMATMSGNFDDATIQLFCAKGLNTAGPFDPAGISSTTFNSVSIPKTTSLTTTTPSTISISSWYTSNPVNFNNTKDPNYTLIGGVANGAGTYYMYNYLFYKTQSTAGAVSAYNNSTSGNKMGAILFALTSSPAGVASTSYSLPIYIGGGGGCGGGGCGVGGGGGGGGG
jgi:hypothetical protein